MSPPLLTNDCDGFVTIVSFLGDSEYKAWDNDLTYPRLDFAAPVQKLTICITEFEKGEIWRGPSPKQIWVDILT